MDEPTATVLGLPGFRLLGVTGIDGELKYLVEATETVVGCATSHDMRVIRHLARGCPPMETRRALDKATVVIDGQPILAHTKVRHDRIDGSGRFALRYRSKLQHVGVGRAHRGRRVLILMADVDVWVIDEDGVLLRHFELDPAVDYPRRDRGALWGFSCPRIAATSQMWRRRSLFELP